MFKKFLIANRGEIACRIIATARRMGVGTVAVYSDADTHALHVQMADEAVHIGPSLASESYLSSEKIIEAALKTGAEAIHPGYGFLSENPDFAETVEAAGLVFIGPPAEAIRAMGLKDAAKRLMEIAGVPVVPGYHGSNQDADYLAAEAERIGCPVLIKARAGGGGKGMRLVQSADDFAPALESARREAQASFGDPACLIEKYIEKPRHIEVQILGDSHGNIVHLFERDCSLQRRHQKVVEEAPAPGMTEEMREAMTAAAVNAAKAIGYRNAGTIEFIADASEGLRTDRFWFMEMNTRLQVEHPATEAITGLDLVELQLRVAAGEPLPYSQMDLAINGHAIEARIYAEDPSNDFLPAVGRVKYLSFPQAGAFQRGKVRIDSGIRQGDEISPWYDPMIAKLITYGADRTEALHRLSQALTDCHIAGTTTNLSFLEALARNADFVNGEPDTDLIARDIASLTKGILPTDEAIAIASLLNVNLLQPADNSDVWQTLRGWRHWGEAEIFSTLYFGDAPIERKIICHTPGEYRIEGGEAPCLIERIEYENASVSYVTDGIRKRANVFSDKAGITVFQDGQTYDLKRDDPLEGSHETSSGSDTVTAPMPGLVKLVSAKAGQQVKKGSALIILEAMKMEHTLKATHDAQIASLHVSEGDQIAGGTLLITLESEGEDADG